jgi:hypothetical protein
MTKGPKNNKNMNISYNNFLIQTGSWSGLSPQPNKYKKITSNITLIDNDTIITFNDLPAGVTVAEPPARTDPKDRAVASLSFESNAVGNMSPTNEGQAPYAQTYPFGGNLLFNINSINCISGSRDEYKNYLSPVDLMIYNKSTSASLPNMQNVSGCIMYQYIDSNTHGTGISGAIFLTGNGVSYVHTGKYTGAVGYTNVPYNSFFTKTNLQYGSYIADYPSTIGVINFGYSQKSVSTAQAQEKKAYNTATASTVTFAPDEILSSYQKISNNSIKVNESIDGLSSPVNRLHVLFNR